MGTHLYVNPGPSKTDTRDNIEGVVTIPVTTTIEVRDGTDHVQLTYTDLDALDETCRMFEEARAAHVGALCEGRSEYVDPGLLKPDDLVVLDGELVCVDGVVICGGDGEQATVSYSKKYQGSYDMTAGRAITVRRAVKVQRLGVALSVVSS